MFHVREYDAAIDLELRAILPKHWGFLFSKEKQGYQVEEYPCEDTL